MEAIVVHVAVTANIDAYDLVLTQLQLQRGAALQHDGDGVQARQASIQRI